jgi:hypothetical protein
MSLFCAGVLGHEHTSYFPLAKLVLAQVRIGRKSDDEEAIEEEKHWCFLVPILSFLFRKQALATFFTYELCDTRLSKRNTPG